VYYYRKGQGVQVKVQKEETGLSLRKNLVSCFLKVFFLGFQISYNFLRKVDSSSLFSMWT